MAQRILLNTSGIKISKPGFNVLTAGPEDLSMDNYKGLLVHHTAVLARPASIPSGGTTTTSFFPALPWHPMFLYHGLRPANSAYGHAAAWSFGTASQSQFQGNLPQVSVLTDRFTIFWTQDLVGSYAAPATHMRVVIFNAQGGA